MERAGYEIVLLLGRAFRAVIGELHDDLARRGHPDARPVHGFALQAIGPDGITAAELGRRLGVTKQAAAKTARSLEDLRYIERRPDPADTRATRLVRTARGNEVLALSARAFEQMRQGLIERHGEERVRATIAVLEDLAGDQPLGDLPGWLHESRSPATGRRQGG